MGKFSSKECTILHKSLQHNRYKNKDMRRDGVCTVEITVVFEPYEHEIDRCIYSYLLFISYPFLKEIPNWHFNFSSARGGGANAVREEMELAYNLHSKLNDPLELALA